MVSTCNNYNESNEKYSSFSFLFKAERIMFSLAMSFYLDIVEFIMKIVPTVSVIDAKCYVTCDAVPACFDPVTTACGDASHTTMLTHPSALCVEALCHV